LTTRSGWTGRSPVVRDRSSPLPCHRHLLSQSLCLPQPVDKLQQNCLCQHLNFKLYIRS
jgi:hypothetical protein